MTLEENKRFMRHFVDEAINRKNLDAIDRLVVPNFIEHVQLPEQGPGRDGLKGAIGMFLTAFPDLAWTTDEQIAEGDKVVSRFTWTGTHRSEFLGIPPTQRSVTVWGVVIDVVKQGKFAESRIIMDTMGLFQQLGVLPGPESGGWVIIVNTRAFKEGTRVAATLRFRVSPDAVLGWTEIQFFAGVRNDLGDRGASQVRAFNFEIAP